MATTYYVDGLNGNDGNLGTSFGQAYATIGKAASVVADGDTVLICATTTYTLGSTVTWNTTGTAANGGITIQGADASGNPLTASGTPPVITSSTNSVALFTLSQVSFHRFRYLKFTHTATTRGNAFVTAGAGNSFALFEGIVVDGCLSALVGTSRLLSPVVEDCWFGNCTSATATVSLSGSQNSYFRDTTIYNSAGDGIRIAADSATTQLNHCIIAKSAGKGFNDIGTTNTVVLLLDDTTIVDNTSDGIASAESTGSFTIYGNNNIIWGNGGIGVNIITQTTLNSDTRKMFNHNFYGSNNGGDLVGLSAGIGDVTGIADPFVSRAGQNWGLNNTAGAGALVQAAGFPGMFRGTNTTGYIDGGAVQHSCFF